jgi:hypothetical protein
MFDLMTIITLVAPAIIVPIACLSVLRIMGRAETTGRASRSSASAARIVLDSATAPVAAEHARERSAA